MMEEKNWYESKTIWGALLAVAASLTGMLGIEVDADTQSKLADVMVQFTGAIGALMAIYGRLNATDVIS